LQRLFDYADLSIQIKQRLNTRFDGFLNQRSFDVKVKRTTAAKALIGAVIGAVAIFAAPVQAKDWKTVTIALEGGYAPWNLTLPTCASASSCNATSWRKTGTA
jgi:octopine/nopaline transport system substrate-binding protein